MFKQLIISFYLGFILSALSVTSFAGTNQIGQGCSNIVDVQQNATGQAICIAPNGDDTKTISIINENGEIDQSITFQSENRPNCRAQGDRNCAADERQICTKKAPPESIVKCLRWACCNKQ